MAAAPTPADEQPPSKKTFTWSQIKGRATTVANIAALFVFLLVAGGFAGYFYSQSRKPAPEDKPTVIENLSEEDLKKLNEIGANLGTTGQVLNIGADALFRGKADITGNLTIGGRLNANGPVTLSQLNITGTTAATGLNVGSNLIVGGTTTMQRSLTVQDLVTINGGLTVSGAVSMNSLNVTSIAVRNLSISGPLTISHLTTQGPTPNLAAGSAIGGGGTVSISGNDTAGTVNLNTGSGPPAGVLATITFRAAYTNTVHVLLSPLTGAAAATPAYVTRTATGFQIRTDAAPPAGSNLSYDYFVTQ
jgi:hypothetical protein